MKSIFDGWEKQIKGKLNDFEGGYCALGWMDKQDPHMGAVYMDTWSRVTRWIENNLEVSGIPDANNQGLLDIEGFKMVDLLTQGYVPEDESDEDRESRLINVEMEKMKEAV